MTLSVVPRIGKHQLKIGLTQCRTKAWIDARTVMAPSLALRNIFLQGNEFEHRVIEQTVDVIHMPVNSTLAIHGTETCNAATGACEAGPASPQASIDIGIIIP